MGAPVTLAGLDVSDPPGRWAALGFAVVPDGSFDAGAVRVTLGLAPPGRGIVGWTLAGAPDGGLVMGLATRSVAVGALRAVGAVHPNGVTGIDHVVVTVPDLDAAGVDFRRRAEVRGRRMGFVRVGGPILEVVEDGDADAPAFWGVTFAVGDAAALDALAADRPRLVGEPRPAVQPGRRIATVTREAGLSTRVAFIDPE